MKDFLRKLFTNPVLANILMLMILVCGAAGYFTMVREIFPRFDMDIIMVSVAYPGADPAEVEEGISIKLEEALTGTEGIKEIRTTSQEGLSSVRIKCYESADVDEVKDKVKNKVDAIITFPKDAENPVVSKVEFKDLVCSIVVWGDAPERELKETASLLERQIQQIKGISQTSVSGKRDYEISIEVSEANLRKFSLDFEKLKKTVRAYGVNVSAGTIRSDREDLRLKIVGRRYHASEYMNIPVLTRTDGTIVTLGQVAKIKDDFDEDSQIISLFNGKPAAAVNIFKTEDEDALKIVALVDKFIKSKGRALPENIHLTKFLDKARMVRDRLHILISNGLMGLCLVFLTLWIFLDIRLSFWVSIGIPVSLAGSLAIMGVCGASINMISMFGLIMVLGLIVDDAIVVGESIYNRRHIGDPPFDAAINGTAEVAMPVVAAVVTTIIAFLPLFFIPDIMGKFIRVMPLPVVAALTVSLVEGLFVLPIHLRHLPKPGLPPKLRISRKMELFRGWIAGKLDYFIENRYAKFIDKTLPNRYLTLSIALFAALTIVGLFQGGFIKFNLLPDSDDDFIQATVELPPGTPLKETAKVAKKLMSAWIRVVGKTEFKNKPLEGAPISKAVFGLIGSSIDWRVGTREASYIEVTIEMLPSEKRNIHFKKLVVAWQKETGIIPGAISTSFGQIQRGPGGMPIAVDVMGDDLSMILKAADDLKREIASKKGTFDISDDFRRGKREFSISLKPAAAKHGITLMDVANQVQGAFYGGEALRVQSGKDDIKIKVKYPIRSGRDSVDSFKKMRIRDAAGNMIPVVSIVKMKLEQGESIIRRKNRMRKVYVASDIDNRKGNANDIIKDLEKNIIPKLEKRYGVVCSVTGQQEQTRDSLDALFLLFPIALFGIYFVIASMFKSYIQPMVIMTTIPFGMMGAVIGHLIFGMNLAIFSLFGMVALAGIVVNDAIVFIECANNRLETGESLMIALREAGKRRFRAIMLTTMTTFAGLMPIIFERSMQAAFLKPMAISIAFGVLFATFITLLLIPCLLVILNDIRRLGYYVAYGRWPTREEVEHRARKRETRPAG
ncbi:MAG: efflux RND transporter permease subunit, partial [Victivallales bacterium]|nr:efflux RND transporter permease subunit [Victivallales bacterium]